MKESEIYAELNSIRHLMERSSKFISLSGLSGVMAGIYALVGALAAYHLLYGNFENLGKTEIYPEPQVVTRLFIIAVLVLLLSVLTGILLTIREARKKHEQFWNPVSKRLLLHLSIPLITGGVLILIMLFKGYFSFIASSCLIFYGLALIAASVYTYTDIRWLGLCQIALGLTAALFPAYGIVFWVVGFSFLHILYGLLMHFKYNR
jgi:hypothetical protein